MSVTASAASWRRIRLGLQVGMVPAKAAIGQSLSEALSDTRRTGCARSAFGLALHHQRPVHIPLACVIHSARLAQLAQALSFSESDDMLTAFECSNSVIKLRSPRRFKMGQVVL